jgi:DNA-binding HxlR family transcriptional regulator
VGDKWTLLIIRDLITGPRRFVELQRVLPGISTEQLRSRLTRMVADGLLTRQRYREVPPRVDYELTERSRELVPVIAELARWGYAWAWSQPRDGEAIDIGAVFRAVPGLAVAPAGIEGVVELRVDGRPYAMHIGHGHSTLVEGPAEQEPEATIAGSQEDWVLALGPQADYSALQLGGDHRIGELVLDAIGPAAARAAVRAA